MFSYTLKPRLISTNGSNLEGLMPFKKIQNKSCNPHSGSHGRSCGLIDPYLPRSSGMGLWGKKWGQSSDLGLLYSRSSGLNSRLCDYPQSNCLFECLILNLELIVIEKQHSWKSVMMFFPHQIKDCFWNSWPSHSVTRNENKTTWC